jgi:hypothetical protein
MNFKLHVTLLTMGLMSFAYLATPARADEWDKMTIFRFNQPVEVPGHVLIPGTYVFKLADLPADRDVVQIFSQDRKGMDHLVTTTMAIPAYRVNTPEKPIITFEERPANTPEAVDKWFYPGDNYGWEFVYPKAERLQVTQNNVAPAPPVTASQPPASAPAPTIAAQPTPQAAPAPAVVERQETVVVAQNEAPAPPSNIEPSANREQLPKTASNVPLAAALGLLMMSAGAGLLGFALVRSRA